MSRIKCGKCHSYHASVAEVRACYARAGVADHFAQPMAEQDVRESVERDRPAVVYPLATPAQLSFIASLFDSRTVPDHKAAWAEQTKRLIAQKVLGKRDASRVIGDLKDFPHKQCPAAQVGVVAPPAHVTQDGMYRNPTTGEIFKVQFNRASGDGRRLYAKQLIVVADGQELTSIPLAGRDKYRNVSAEFVYVSGAVAKLRPEWLMTMAEAKAFGALYGTCVRCGRTLTAEDSIERMMGPVCAGKNRWA